MDTTKTVSVVMCTYNGERYVREQLDSIVAQTYPVAEIIIQDDCSTDSTPAICREYAARYPAIRFYQNERNVGFNLNFRRAAMRAKGDYVAFSDQDDVWMAHKIERQVAAIGTHDICFSTHLRGPDPLHSHVVSPQYALPALLFVGFAGHTMLLRRGFVQNQEYWIDHIIYDWSLAICAQLHGGIVMVDEPLNWHRDNADSACHVMMAELGRQQPQKPTYQPYLQGFGNYRRLQQKPNWKALYTYIYFHTKEPRFSLAHRMIRYMLSPRPSSLLKLCWLCMRHRHTVYYKKNVSGLRGLVRGFFYPFIFSYNNVQYDLE